ncbi:MAG: endonuclease/exonuclease/phosphatase family protein [Opitutales bacterium]
MLLAVLPIAARAGAAIRIDGEASDWTGVGEVVTDEEGNLPRPGADLASVAVTHDFSTLYVKVEYAGEPPAAPDLHLYFDSDGDTSTGFGYLGRGMDLTWSYAADEGSYLLEPSRDLNRGEFLLRSAYDPLTGTLEMAFALGLLREARWQQCLALAVYEGSSLDRVPDFGAEALTYCFDDPVWLNHPENSLARSAPEDLRILSWNVLFDAPLANEAAEARFGRVLAATRPDIVCFQELYDASAAWAREFMNTWVPLEPGAGFWRAVKNHDCITVSRFPIDDFRFVDGNLVTLIDTRSILGRRSYVLNAHTPCCANTTGRLEEMDAFMADLRGQMEAARAGEEAPFAIFLVGDMNIGGANREMLTMVEGDIHDERRHGGDFDPDWDGTGLTDAAPAIVLSDRIETWRSLGNRDNTSRLDYIIYADSVAQLSKRYVLNTRRVPEAFNARYGLTLADTDSSDHLPLVADFRPRAAPAPWGGATLEGSGWLADSWMGPVLLQRHPYVWSAEHERWFYVVPREGGAWFHDRALGWWWTTPEVYPFFYVASAQSWAWWARSDRASRHYYTFADGRWQRAG